MIMIADALASSIITVAAGSGQNSQWEVIGSEGHNNGIDPAKN